VRDGETGWLNASRDAPGLAALLGRAIASPDEVDRLAASVRARRDELVISMPRHAAEVEELYREVVAGRRANTVVY
jgi:hypothetical protein